MKISTGILVKGFSALAGLLLAAALVGCQSHPAPVENSGNAPKPRASTPNPTDARRLSSGANKLLEAMTKPTQSFHFSYQGQENINDKYPMDKTQAPKVGPVILEADISPQENDIVQTRGQTKSTSKALKTDELNWSMGNLALLGVMTNVNFSIAVGSTVASSPTSDLVGTTLTDKYTYDTAMANPTQKMALDIARSMLTAIKDSKGTAWIAKDTGIMVKFNIDTDYLAKDGHAWKEHYEGVVTPK
jgi:hypothetical protein